MPRPREFDEAKALDRAVDAFWQRGYDATGVQDLCAAMDLNPGSLYGAFGDKRALFLAALDRYMQSVSTLAIDCLGGAPSGMEGIRALFEHVIGAMTGGKRKWGCLITNSVAELSLRDPEVAAKVRVHLARVETAFAGALVRAKAAGELAEGVGSESAPYLVCVLQGLNVLAKTMPGRQALSAIVNVALRGLSPNFRPLE
ncbi:MAG TPA: TetR/AcrR family transcriptional regulator [Burkholderiales bacterium]|nr:TetR/AcrR family transcriptional regulator [Burkholderiales bacterium]